MSNVRYLKKFIEKPYGAQLFLAPIENSPPKMSFVRPETDVSDYFYIMLKKCILGNTVIILVNLNNTVTSPQICTF